MPSLQADRVAFSSSASCGSTGAGAREDAAATTRATSASERDPEGALSGSAAAAGAGAAGDASPPPVRGLMNARTFDAEARSCGARVGHGGRPSAEALLSRNSPETHAGRAHLAPRLQPALLYEEAAEVSANIGAVIGLVEVLEVRQALVARGAVAVLVAVGQDEHAARLEDAGELARSLDALLRSRGSGAGCEWARVSSPGGHGALEAKHRNGGWLRARASSGSSWKR